MIRPFGAVVRIRSASSPCAAAAAARDARTAMAIRCLRLMHRILSAPTRIACSAVPGVLLFGAGDCAVADDAARISRLETEIQQLRAHVDEQSRRIQRLEVELRRRAGPAGLAEPQPKPRVGEMRTDAPAAAGRRPGIRRRPGTRVKQGMTEAEVIAILGPPTAADSVGALKSLFYRGTAPGGRAVERARKFQGRPRRCSQPDPRSSYTYAMKQLIALPGPVGLLGHRRRRRSAFLCGARQVPGPPRGARPAPPISRPTASKVRRN